MNSKGNGAKVDLVAEAERIVGGCAGGAAEKQKKQDAGFDALLNAVMALSCVMLAVVLGISAG